MCIDKLFSVVTYIHDSSKYDWNLNYEFFFLLALVLWHKHINVFANIAQLSHDNKTKNEDSAKKWSGYSHECQANLSCK